MFNIHCAVCSQVNEAPQVICHGCGHVLPFYTMNPFFIFKLTPTLTIEKTYMDQHYFKFQRQLHPDKLNNAPAQELQWAQQHISQINQAYKALQNKILLAKATVLYVKGDFSLPLESFDDQEIPLPSMEFLTEVMKLQDSLSMNEIVNLYDHGMMDLKHAVDTLNLNNILQALSKLTYIERLRQLRKED